RVSHSPFFFFFYCSSHHRHLPSFPTRRSSDLGKHLARHPPLLGSPGRDIRRRVDPPHASLRPAARAHDDRQEQGPGVRRAQDRRSEEHTSELQSLRHLVCRLLLEKKKKKRK